MLWKTWFEAVAPLRPACSRQRTFYWMVLCLMGLCLRTELAGVTSFVRVLGLEPALYQRLLHLFHSPAIKLDKLTEIWTRWCADSFPACTVGAYRVWIADGLKAPKEGRKMPAVKKLHQESANNSKPEFIFGHSFQCISQLTQTAQGFVAAVPAHNAAGGGVRRGALCHARVAYPARACDARVRHGFSRPPRDCHTVRRGTLHLLCDTRAP